MATAYEKLVYINETKKEIAEAIREQDVEVTEEDTFRSYADKVREIKGKVHSVNGQTGDVVITLEDLGGVSSDDVYTKSEVDDLIDSVDVSDQLTDYAKKSEIPTKVSELENDSKYQTETEVNDAIEKVIGTAPEALDTLGEIADRLGEDSDAIDAINGVLSGKANSDDVYTKTEVDDIVDNIDTSNVVKLTQAEYDALETKDENTLYVITDAEPVTIDLSDYYTKTEVDNLIDGVEVDFSDYYTKTEVDGIVGGLETDINNRVSKNEFNGSIETLGEQISQKANSSDVYTKTEVDDLISNVEVDLSDYATTEDVENLLTEAEEVRITLPDVTREIVLDDETSTKIWNAISNKKSLVVKFNGDYSDFYLVYDFKGYNSEQDANMWVKTFQLWNVDKLYSLYIYSAMSKGWMRISIDNLEDNSVDLTGYATEEWVGDNYYNKTYIDGVVNTVTTQLNSKLPIDSFNEWSEGVAMKADVYTKDEIDDKLGDINSVLENILS